MDDHALARLREIALELPGVTERVSHGAPCFFVADKRPICYFHDHHGGDDRLTLWCPAPSGVAEELALADPERFFKPPTSKSGVFDSWLGMVLDPLRNQTIDWDEIAAVIEEAYRTVARRRLVIEPASGEAGWGTADRLGVISGRGHAAPEDRGRRSDPAGPALDGA